MNSPLLYEMRELSKSYSNGTRDIPVLVDVNMEIRKGETVAVTGPSGVGKSTLLHILGLLDKSGGGTLRFDGVDVGTMGEFERARFRNSRIGFVFQFFQLLPEFTALENVMMPALIAGEDPAACRKRALRLLSEMGLERRAHHRPGELSGGEQQRTAIARALLMEPDVVLADEPTGNLDPVTGGEIELLMTELNRAGGTTLIVVTHKESLSRAMDRRVGLVEGRIEELS